MSDDSSGGVVFDAPDAPGPYGVSATTIEWQDERGRDLVAEIWYPIGLEADGTWPCSPEPYPDLPISGLACRDQEPLASPDPDGFPIVAFSHGNAGIRFQSIFLTEVLAEHGYVVIAPDHPHNTLLDFDEDQIAEVAMRRPGDITSAVDELIRGSTPPLSTTTYADSPLHSLTVNPVAFGMIGHSFGGWTTTAVDGGAIDVDGLLTFCADPDNAAVGYDLCQLVDAFPAGTTDADFDPPDDRAITGVPMAPAGWYSFDADAVGVEPNGLDDVAPTLLFGGTRDESETVETEIQPLYDRLPGGSDRNALAILQNAGHYTFSDICLVGDIQPECAEEADGYINIEEAHGIIDELVLAWLGVHQLGDERYQEYLDRADGEWADLAFTP